jgi:Uri superfamily endonuclease
MRHHLRVTDKPHWHVDWLRKMGELAFVYYKISSAPLECSWFQKFSTFTDFSMPVTGFGSSDCANGCQAHLLFTPLSNTRELRRSIESEIQGWERNGVQWEG